MTDNELKYQIMTFLLAGHETTSVSTSWALYFLSKYPHMQDLLREELVKAFPDKSKFNPTFDEINSLEYLNCVVKETLRLNPPVGATSRLNTKDEVFGGYHVPKNTVMIIAISTLHQLPEIWGPTATEFDPKRWNFVFKPIEGFHIKRRIVPMNKPDPYLRLSVSKVEN
ncbi:unnamed protein product [Rhizophagus irregularis]|nr:unnamed protein product [Rhizophagus irregularis]